ncbi:MAG: serine/threonine-protein kinase [Syntrophales bacterium]
MEDNFRKEFLVRYRLPRPVSRAYEAVCFSLNEEDIIQKVKWCAGIAVRFLSLVRQAHLLTRDETLPINPPHYRDLDRILEEDFFKEKLERKDLLPLLQLAGIYRGMDIKEAPSAILPALESIVFLEQFKIIIMVEKGFNVLLGPHLEYPVKHEHTKEFMMKAAPGTPLLVNPQDGRFVSLNPLAAWVKDPHHPFGHLFFLRRMEGDTGWYIEEGIPGSPGLIKQIEGRPITGTLPVEDGILKIINSLPVRFPDGCSVEEKYEILGIIWRGGTSDIYIAQKRANHEPVILKTFEYVSGVFDENYRYFINEERYSRDINHPNIVKPRKVYLKSAGTVYEQDLVHQGSLCDLIQANGVLTPFMSKRIMGQLLGAIAAIHGAGIIHNDLKPDNILFDSDGKLKVIDFGLAFRVSDLKQRLRPGVPAGTPGYMAPEILEGGAPNIASDIYAAGVILTEMLSGDRCDSPEEIRNHREIPAEFYPFLDRCLAMRIEDRFASAPEARRCLDTLPVVAHLAITLDIEGTLINNSYEHVPRPGLYEFLDFCLKTFDRVFVYTSVGARDTRTAFEILAACGSIPSDFNAQYEYVEWPRGSDGSLKDLRLCKVPLEYNAIVDDFEWAIPEDQRHRWIPVTEYNEENRFDRGLSVARNTIEKKFALANLNDKHT